MAGGAGGGGVGLGGGAYLSAKVLIETLLVGRRPFQGHNNALPC